MRCAGRTKRGAEEALRQAGFERDFQHEVPRHGFAAIALTVLLAGSGRAAEPVPARLRVEPGAVELTGARDRQGLVVQAEFADGSTRDVTAAAEMTFDRPVATITNGFVAPAADGTATLRVRYAGHTTTLPVTVRKATEAEPLRFRNDVLPVLTRAGCNTGKCHGAASGKDGFRLSLFGYDPAGDHFRLTHELSGRRVNLASPDDCLLVNKATGKVSHTGGRRLEPGGEGYLLLVRWLEASAPKDPPSVARPVALDVFPREVVFAAKGDTQRIVVRAKYSDGTDRDVTRFAVFMGNNDSAADRRRGGLPSRRRGRGEAFVLARSRPVHRQAAGARAAPERQFAAAPTPAFNYMDTLVQALSSTSCALAPSPRSAPTRCSSAG